MVNLFDDYTDRLSPRLNGSVPTCKTGKVFFFPLPLPFGATWAIPNPWLLVWEPFLRQSNLKESQRKPLQACT